MFVHSLVLQQVTRVDFTITTPDYPGYYSNGSCVCTLTTSADQDRFTVNVKFASYEARERVSASCARVGECVMRESG